MKRLLNNAISPAATFEGVTVLFLCPIVLLVPFSANRRIVCLGSRKEKGVSLERRSWLSLQVLQRSSLPLES